MNDSRQNIRITDKDIDLIRDSSLKLQNVDLDKALSLMELAHRLRPSGKLIHSHLEAMREICKADWKRTIKNLQICPEKKVIFVHIPKAGGTSVDNSNLFNERKSGHSTYDYLKGFISKHDNLEEYKVFCFTRNPWDRFASAFHYLSTGGGNKGDLMISRQYFSEFNNDFSPFLKKFICNPEVYLHLLHFKPMVSFIQPEKVEIPMFIQKLEEVERLDNLRKFLSYPLAIGHHRAGSSRGATQKSLYTKQQFIDLGKIYHEDIKAFGYEEYEICDIMY